MDEGREISLGYILESDPQHVCGEYIRAKSRNPESWQVPFDSIFSGRSYNKELILSPISPIMAMQSPTETSESLVAKTLSRIPEQGA